MDGEPTSITDELARAAVGHPYAKIPWPHRLLHEAIEHIETLTAERDRYKTVLDAYRKWDAAMQFALDAWPMEMAKKAIIKRAAKQWPRSEGSSVLHKTIEVINDAEGSADPMAELERTADEILNLIESDDELEVGRIWCECTEQEQSTLWTAKTKGGWFTMQEKDYIRGAVVAYKKANQEEDAAA